MLSGLMKNFGQDAKAQQARTTSSFSDNAPSWQELEQLVRSKQSELGVDFWADPEQAPTNPWALKRTFGKAGPIRVKLYRDHAAWCPYCHKVWLQLEEKQIPYTIEKINMRCYGDKPASFLAKVRNGLLPVMELDGNVVTESAVIMALLEDEFPDRPLMPQKGTPERQRADLLMRLERQFFSDWLGWLCGGYSPAAAKRKFESTMTMVDQAMETSGGPYFLGSDISLVDITFTPMLERAAASLAYYKGFHIRGEGRWPAVDRWFNAMESRSTYIGTRSDYYTTSHDLPPQLGGCVMEGDGEQVSAMLDGSDGRHWRLPLAPLSATSLPEPYSLGDNPSIDTVEAAAKVIKNNQAIVKFSLRGPGQPGPRPVSAPLSDPSAVPALEYLDAADAAMRHVVHALLLGVDAKQGSSQALQVSSDSAKLPGEPVIQAAKYLRDRVGVPRDMRFPAARQLRAHLNWLIDNLSAA